MAQIREIRDAQRRRRRLRTLRRILILILLLSILAAIILNRDKLSPQAISQWLSGSISADRESEGFPVKLPSGDAVSLQAVGTNLVMTNQTSICFYSSRGRLLRSVQHSRKNVQSKAAGDYVLVYAVGGKEASVETRGKTAVSFEADNAIITGSVSKSGRFVLATESDVYTCEMKVYDKAGNAVFKWTPSGSAIITAALSPDGGYVAAATVSAQGGRIVSGIHLFSTSKSEAVLSYQLPDELVLSLQCEKNSVRVISDAQMFTLSGDEPTGVFSFDGRRLIDCCESGSEQILVFEDVNDPGKSVLSIVDGAGVVRAEAPVAHKISRMACFDKNIYLLSDDLLLCYDAATAIKSGESRIETDGRFVCATSAGVYVITAASELVRVSLQ